MLRRPRSRNPIAAASEHIVEHPSEVVKRLKQKLSEKNGIPAAQQRLVFSKSPSELHSETKGTSAEELLTHVNNWKAIVFRDQKSIGCLVGPELSLDERTLEARTPQPGGSSEAQAISVVLVCLTYSRWKIAGSNPAGSAVDLSLELDSNSADSSYRIQVFCQQGGRTLAVPSSFSFSGRALASAVSVELQRQEYIRLHQLRRSKLAKPLKQDPVLINISLGEGVGCIQAVIDASQQPLKLKTLALSFATGASCQNLNEGPPSRPTPQMSSDPSQSSLRDSQPAAQKDTSKAKTAKQVAADSWLMDTNKPTASRKGKSKSKSSHARPVLVTPGPGPVQTPATRNTDASASVNKTPAETSGASKSGQPLSGGPGGSSKVEQGGDSEWLLSHGVTQQDHDANVPSMVSIGVQTAEPVLVQPSRSFSPERGSPGAALARSRLASRTGSVESIASSNAGTRENDSKSKPTQAVYTIPQKRKQASAQSSTAELVPPPAAIKVSTAMPPAEPPVRSPSGVHPARFAAGRSGQTRGQAAPSPLFQTSSPPKSKSPLRINVPAIGVAPTVADSEFLPELLFGQIQPPIDRATHIDRLAKQQAAKSPSKVSHSPKKRSKQAVSQLEAQRLRGPALEHAERQQQPQGISQTAADASVSVKSSDAKPVVKLNKRLGSSVAGDSPVDLSPKVKSPLARRPGRLSKAAVGGSFSPTKQGPRNVPPMGEKRSSGPAKATSEQTLRIGSGPEELYAEADGTGNALRKQRSLKGNSSTDESSRGAISHRESFTTAQSSTGLSEDGSPAKDIVLGRSSEMDSSDGSLETAFSILTSSEPVTPEAAGSDSLGPRRSGSEAPESSALAPRGSSGDRTLGGSDSTSWRSQSVSASDSRAKTSQRRDSVQQLSNTQLAHLQLGSQSLFQAEEAGRQLLTHPSLHAGTQDLFQPDRALQFGYNPPPRVETGLNLHADSARAGSPLPLGSAGAGSSPGASGRGSLEASQAALAENWRGMNVAWPNGVRLITDPVSTIEGSSEARSPKSDSSESRIEAQYPIPNGVVTDSSGGEIYGHSQDGLPNGVVSILGAPQPWNNRGPARPMSERNFSSRGTYEDSPMRGFENIPLPAAVFTHTGPLGSSPRYRAREPPPNGLNPRQEGGGADSPWGPQFSGMFPIDLPGPGLQISSAGFPMRGSESDLRGASNLGESRRGVERWRNGSWTPPPPPPPRYQPVDAANPVSQLIERQSSFQVSAPELVTEFERHRGPPRSDLERFIACTTPVLEARESSGLAPKELCLGDVWQSFEDASSFGKEIYTRGGQRGPALAFYTPTLSALRVFLPCKESDRQEGETRVVSVVQHFEMDLPYLRDPLSGAVGDLKSPLQNDMAEDSWHDIPLNRLHPASWFAVAWYPIYRIPDSPLSAKFLSYHSLQPQQVRHTHFGVLEPSTSSEGDSPSQRGLPDTRAGPTPAQALHSGVANPFADPSEKEGELRGDSTAWCCPLVGLRCAEQRHERWMEPYDQSPLARQEWQERYQRLHQQASRLSAGQDLRVQKPDGTWVHPSAPHNDLDWFSNHS